MNRITKVTLTGFKGIHREYDLSPATVFSGPNGSGKSSCVEGLIYALTGSTPAGKSEDRVAQYFPARGGRVKVEDSDGNWIERGIIRDFAKAKVSSQLRTSDDAEDAEEPDLSRWKAAGAVLDLREFLGLSPEKRREFVLKLCGQGQGDDDIWPAIELAFFREVGGPGANLDLATMGTNDLGEELAALLTAWKRPRGLAEVLQSYLTSGKSLSETFLKLGEVAKEQRLAARREGQQAAAAEQELEAEAHGARAAAADVKAHRSKVEKLREELTACRGGIARLEEAQRGLVEAERRLAEAEVASDKALKAAAETPQPGTRPEAPGADPRREVLQSKLIDCQARIMLLKQTMDGCRQVQDQRRVAEGDLQRAQAALKGWETHPLGKLQNLMDEIPIDAHPKIEDLREVVWEVCGHWQDQFLQLENDVAAFTKKAEDLRQRSAGAGKKLIDLQGELAEEEGTVLALREEISALDGSQAGSFGEYKVQLARWERRDRAYRQAQERLKGAEAALQAAEKACETAEARVESLDEVNGGELEQLQEKLVHAQHDQELAEKAAGALQAYDSASARARQAQVDQAAWGHAEKAIQSVRERLVGAATAGLLSDLNAILQAAGREENVYLELENDRGKPIFELGWARAGVRTALPALSAGEAVIFCAALSVALTKRSPGRRLLLIEADPLDLKNLESLLRALAPQAAELEALVVATAAVGWKAPQGWEVVVLEKVPEPRKKKVGGAA